MQSNGSKDNLKFSPKANLERMKAARKLRVAQMKPIKFIHVGGTNGKGSVCSFLTNVLSKSYKVGTFTSPYIVSFNERIKNSI